MLGTACARAGDAERTRLRRRHLGFVYQRHHLLPECSAEENVMMPLLLAGAAWGEARAQAAELLARVGLEARRTHRPAELSGGEQQRVAIARALVARPSLVLADEPTGNLDPETGGEVFALMVETIRAASAAALIATHNRELAARMDRILSLPEINRG
jgi:lipoprotein-releasing system ATP-binding protein